MITNTAEAKDFGYLGETKEIIEPDLLEHITNKLAHMKEVDIITHQEKIKKQVIDKIKRPKAVSGITKAIEHSVRLHDPSFTVMEDIKDNLGNLIHAKGTTINPLNYLSFNETWIFIDGDDEEQLELARQYSNAKVILVNGSPGIQSNGEWHYFDQAGEICKQLNITKVPTVVRQSGKMIEINEIP